MLVLGPLSDLKAGCLPLPSDLSEAESELSGLQTWPFASRLRLEILGMVPDSACSSVANLEAHSEHQEAARQSIRIVTSYNIL